MLVKVSLKQLELDCNKISWGKNAKNRINTELILFAKLCMHKKQVIVVFQVLKAEDKKTKQKSSILSDFKKLNSQVLLKTHSKVIAFSNGVMRDI